MTGDFSGKGALSTLPIDGALLVPLQVQVVVDGIPLPYYPVPRLLKLDFTKPVVLTQCRRILSILYK